MLVYSLTTTYSRSSTLPLDNFCSCARRSIPVYMCARSWWSDCYCLWFLPRQSYLLCGQFLNYWIWLYRCQKIFITIVVYSVYEGLTARYCTVLWYSSNLHNDLLDHPFTHSIIICVVVGPWLFPGREVMWVMAFVVTLVNPLQRLTLIILGAWSSLLTGMACLEVVASVAKLQWEALCMEVTLFLASLLLCARLLP